MTSLRALFRRWQRAPLLPLIAVAVLASGVAAGTAVFGAAWAAVLRPLPYPAADRLVRVHSMFPRMQLTSMGLSAEEAAELGQLSTTFADLGFGYVASAAVSADGASTEVPIADVTRGMFTTLGVAPIVGTLPTVEDDRPGGPLVAMIGEGLWQRAFGRDPQVVGRTIVVDGRPATIAGVLPASVDLAGTAVDLWVPLQYEYRPASPEARRARANHIYTVVARLKTDVSQATARADLDRAVSVWSSTVGPTHAPAPDFHPLGLTPLDEVVRGGVRGATSVIVAAVVLVLLIAGANTSTLLIAQSEARRTEMAVRAALGAGRSALWRLHATEAFLLSGVSAILAVVLAQGLLRALSALAPPALATRMATLPFWQTIVIAAGVSAITGVACSLAPLGRLRLARIVPALAAEGRGGTASAERGRLRRMLVGAEIALALTLFASAAVLVESFWRLTNVDPGFRPDGVVRARISLPGARYTAPGQVAGVYASIVARVAALPGVTNVGLMSGLPPERRSNNTSLQPDVSGLDLHTGVPPVEFLQFVDSHALDVIGLPVVSGRGFTDADAEGAAPVALLNRRAAATYFPGVDPIGRRIRGMGAGLPWLTVVGVVGNAHQAGLARDVGTEIFVPLAQASNLFGQSMTRDLNVVVKTSAATSEALGRVLRPIVAEVEPLAALSDVEVMRTVILDSLSTPRFLMFVLSAFAGVALLLCGAGVYGVVAHVVAERTREIGVRRALGAETSAIVALVARQVAALVSIGLVAGVAGAMLGTRALQSFTFQTPALSLVRLALVIGVLAATAALACVVPLVRALRVDPATALRCA